MPILLLLILLAVLGLFWPLVALIWINAAWILYIGAFLAVWAAFNSIFLTDKRVDAAWKRKLGKPSAPAQVSRPLLTGRWYSACYAAGKILSGRY
jgi:hypothetical protein